MKSSLNQRPYQKTIQVLELLDSEHHIFFLFHLHQTSSSSNVLVQALRALVYMSWSTTAPAHWQDKGIQDIPKLDRGLLLHLRLLSLPYSTIVYEKTPGAYSTRPAVSEYCTVLYIWPLTSHSSILWSHQATAYCTHWFLHYTSLKQWMNNSINFLIWQGTVER